MTWTNYHTHCYLCDGQGELEAYVAEARQQGLYALGFSSHAPLPFENDWTLSAEGLQTYVAKINQLKMECAETLPIYLSLEIDYIPGETSPTIPRFQSIGLDYTLGAVHFAGKDDQGEYWSIDHTAEVFVAGLKAIYDNNIQAAVGTYYQIVRDMIKNHCPDVVAHLDLIKKNNTNSKYFAEDEVWYQAEVIKTLDMLAESNAILEVNTGGIARRRTDSFYPSPWILELCLQRGIPLTLNSDAHHPSQITAEFNNAASTLREVGYQEVYIFERGGWHACSFSPEGLIK